MSRQERRSLYSLASSLTTIVHSVTSSCIIKTSLFARSYLLTTSRPVWWRLLRWYLTKIRPTRAMQACWTTWAYIFCLGRLPTRNYRLTSLTLLWLQLWTRSTKAGHEKFCPCNSLQRGKRMCWLVVVHKTVLGWQMADPSLSAAIPFRWAGGKSVHLWWYVVEAYSIPFLR